MNLTLNLDPAAAVFYEQIAKAARLPLEQVLCDALLKLAGELSLEVLLKKEKHEL